MTGHGEKRSDGSWHGIKLKENEVKAIRNHLLNGGFLHIDDNYNFDKSFFPEMKKVFPEKEWNKLHIQIIMYARNYCPARGCFGLECSICKTCFPNRKSKFKHKKP